MTTLTRPTAQEKLADPLNLLRPAKVLRPLPPIEVTKLSLKGKKLDADIAQAVTGGEMERTIEGASTLTLTLHDPDLELLRAKGFTGDIDLKLDRFYFRLARTAKDGPTITLTFEDREVAWLRSYSKPRRAYRDKQTRAEFVQSLIREVKQGRIRLIAPELHKRQPIGTTKVTTKLDRITPKERAVRNSTGFAKGVKLTIKGVQATAYQLRQAERALTVAENLKAPDLAKLALIVAGIGESTFRTPINSLGYGGVFQGQVNTGGRYFSRDDTEAMAYCFLKGGKGFQGGGAIALSKQGGSPGSIAVTVEGSGVGGAFYDKHRAEAQRILAAFQGRGETGGTTITADVTTPKRYAFTRGTAKQKENSWQTIQRLATEEDLGWRGFMVEGVLYFISEQDLFKSKPRFTFSEQSPGIKEINFELDRNLHVSEAHVLCRADLWEADPGTVVVLEDCGPADGRWLVTNMRRGIWDRDTDITLKQPMKEGAEPAAETSTKSVSVGAASDQSGNVHKGKGNKLEGGTAYDRLYAACEEISAKAGAYSYGGGHGPPLSSMSPATRLDCSSSTSLALYMAGMMTGNVAQVSGWFATSWGEPGQGKKFTVWANAGHVFIELYGRDKQRFDTGQHSGSGPRLVSPHRSDHSGLTPRHWPGM